MLATIDATTPSRTAVKSRWSAAFSSLFFSAREVDDVIEAVGHADELLDRELTVVDALRFLEQRLGESPPAAPFALETARPPTSHSDARRSRTFGLTRANCSDRECRRLDRDSSPARPSRWRAGPRLRSRAFCTGASTSACTCIASR